MLTEKEMQTECQKLIQAYMDTCKFREPNDAGKALGNLIMMATMALDSIMGDEYTMRTIIAVAERMESGEPQKKVQMQIINRSMMN